jgi:hypothetical protein
MQVLPQHKICSKIRKAIQVFPRLALIRMHKQLLAIQKIEQVLRVTNLKMETMEIIAMMINTMVIVITMMLSLRTKGLKIV